MTYGRGNVSRFDAGKQTQRWIIENWSTTAFKSIRQFTLINLPQAGSILMSNASTNDVTSSRIVTRQIKQRHSAAYPEWTYLKTDLQASSSSIVKSCQTFFTRSTRSTCASTRIYVNFTCPKNASLNFQNCRNDHVDKSAHEHLGNPERCIKTISPDNNIHKPASMKSHSKQERFKPDQSLLITLILTLPPLIRTTMHCRAWVIFK